VRANFELNYSPAARPSVVATHSPKLTSISRGGVNLTHATAAADDRLPRGFWRTTTSTL
jgi:hypothetical protein